MKAVLSSLADFLSAGLRPRTPLAKAITVALVVKLVVVVSMKVFLFSGDARPVVDDAVMNRVIGPSGSAHRPLTVSPPTLSKATEPREPARSSGG
jgi:hypothetical protein